MSIAEMELALPTSVPAVKKYVGALAVADVEEFTESSNLVILQTMRLDLGAVSQVHS